MVSYIPFSFQPGGAFKNFISIFFWFTPSKPFWLDIQYSALISVNKGFTFDSRKVFLTLYPPESFRLQCESFFLGLALMLRLVARLARTAALCAHLSFLLSIHPGNKTHGNLCSHLYCFCCCFILLCNRNIFFMGLLSVCNRCKAQGTSHPLTLSSLAFHLWKHYLVKRPLQKWLVCGFEVFFSIFFLLHRLLLAARWARKLQFLNTSFFSGLPLIVGLTRPMVPALNTLSLFAHRVDWVGAKCTSEIL